MYEEKTSRSEVLDASSCNVLKCQAGTGPQKVTEGEHAACWNATLRAVTNNSVSDCKDILSGVLQNFVFNRSLSNILISALVGCLTD